MRLIPPCKNKIMVGDKVRVGNYCAYMCVRQTRHDREESLSRGHQDNGIGKVVFVDNSLECEEENYYAKVDFGEKQPYYFFDDLTVLERNGKPYDNDTDV
jgi:hypothetical protein